MPQLRQKLTATTPTLSITANFSWGCILENMNKTVVLDDVRTFKTLLAGYKSRIDEDIQSFSHNLMSQTGEQFGPYSAESMGVFVDVLSRGGKRIRGALTMLAYEMFGGTNPDVSVQAARIMELIQTYLLIVDDVYDKSKTRRGKPSAHMMLSALHEERSWAHDSGHFGESIAINCGIIGCHLALGLVTELDVSPELIVRATKSLNTNLQITGEGQANDVFNEVTESSSKSQIDNVLIWKTAYYTFVNPLQFGAILAGASEKDVELLCQYSLAAGRVFQITDDILGTFGDEFDSGKSPMDDIREGKRTLLTLHALKNSPKEDAYFLERMLGNAQLTAAEFKKCKDILFAAGSLEYARSEAELSARDAVELAQRNWRQVYPDQTQFLMGLVEYLLTRKS
jgi:geranylgeranyl diphosphate synthase, type I